MEPSKTKNDQWEEIEAPTAEPSSEGISLSRRGITYWLVAGACLSWLITTVTVALLANFLLRRGTSLLGSEAGASASQTAEGELSPAVDGQPPETSGDLPTAVPGPNLEIVVDGSTMTVINTSSRPVSLVDVSFRRISQDGSYTASFEAQQWQNISGQPIGNMPSGDCFQVRGSEGRQAKPSNCDTIQAWLATANRGWYFWAPADGERNFAVLHGGEVIHICRIPVSRCVFYLPQP